MSVYKEFYAGIKHIKENSAQIFNDAADYGALSTDDTWDWAAQLSEWYGLPETRKVHRYETGLMVEIEIEGIDEWAVSDRRKTIKQATERYKLVYVESTALRNKGYKGYFYVHQL